MLRLVVHPLCTFQLNPTNQFESMSISMCFLTNTPRFAIKTNSNDAKNIFFHSVPRYLEPRCRHYISLPYILFKSFLRHLRPCKPYLSSHGWGGQGLGEEPWDALLRGLGSPSAECGAGLQRNGQPSGLRRPASEFALWANKVAEQWRGWGPERCLEGVVSLRDFSATRQCCGNSPQPEHALLRVPNLCSRSLWRWILHPKRGIQSSNLIQDSLGCC